MITDLVLLDLCMEGKMLKYHVQQSVAAINTISEGLQILSFKQKYQWHLELFV